MTDAATVTSALDTPLPSGLTARRAADRLGRDGPNELRAVAPPSAWRRALAQPRDPLAYLRRVAAAVALAA